MALLGLSWSADGQNLFSGGCDNQAMMCKLQAKQQAQVAQHEQPISAIKALSSPWPNCVATASWDASIKVCIPYLCCFSLGD